jgi:NifB/MoaA-like Fe-S oxidoreductase
MVKKTVRELKAIHAKKVKLLKQEGRALNKLNKKISKGPYSHVWSDFNANERRSDREVARKGPKIGSKYSHVWD